MRLARAVEPLEQQERQLRREVTMQTEELVEARAEGVAPGCARVAGGC